MSKDLEIKLNRSEFRAIMNSAGVSQLLGYEADRARYRAESVSGLSFGSGVDHRTVSARGWVGASSVDKRTGRVNAGLHAKQAEALAKSLHGV